MHKCKIWFYIYTQKQKGCDSLVAIGGTAGRQLNGPCASSGNEVTNKEWNWQCVIDENDRNPPIMNSMKLYPASKMFAFHEISKNVSHE